QCTGNSARSQMAEGLLRSLGGPDFEVFSAGAEPKGLHPLAVEVMREAGVDISGQRSKPLGAFLGQNFDYVITVCDRARDRCPTFPGDNEHIHWGFDDPAVETGDAAKQLAIFRRVRNEISERLRIWITVQRKRLKERQPIQ
ncbi:MAG: arsenate reductase ArsC, partial [Gammaproteobacteria bacterium]